MDNRFVMPKGRQTVRQNGGRRTRLWELADSKNLTVQKLEAAYLAGFEAMDRVETRHAQNKTDSRFTPDGVKDDLLKFVLNEAVPALHQSRMTIRKAKDEVAERRGKLKLAGPDKSDIAGALRRQEIRQRLSAMKPDEQSAYFGKYGDNLPAEVAVAVVELPPEFSNVPPSRHDLLIESELNAQFGPEIQEIQSSSRRSKRPRAVWRPRVMRFVSKLGFMTSRSSTSSPRRSRPSTAHHGCVVPRTGSWWWIWRRGLKERPRRPKLKPACITKTLTTTNRKRT